MLSSGLGDLMAKEDGEERETFLDFLTRDQRAELFQVWERKVVQQGKTLFEEGDEPDGLYIIDTGYVRVSFESPRGKSQTVAIYGPGDIVGEFGVIDGLPRSATATAQTISTLRFISIQRFENLLAEHGDIALILLRVVVRRVRNTSVAFEDRVFLGREQRLAKRLLDLVDQFGQQVPDGIRLDRELSQTDLGNTVDLTRESVNKTIQDWTREGILIHVDGFITIFDMDRLAFIAHGRSGSA